MRYCVNNLYALIFPLFIQLSTVLWWIPKERRLRSAYTVLVHFLQDYTPLKFLGIDTLVAPRSNAKLLLFHGFVHRQTAWHDLFFPVYSKPSGCGLHNSGPFILPDRFPDLRHVLDKVFIRLIHVELEQFYDVAPEPVQRIFREELPRIFLVLF